MGYTEQPGDSDAIKNVLALLRQMKEGKSPPDIPSPQKEEAAIQHAFQPKRAAVDFNIAERRRLIEALVSDATLSYRLAPAKTQDVIAILGEAERHVHNRTLIPESLMTIVLVHTLLQGQEITSRDEQKFIAAVLQEAAARCITSDRLEESLLHLIFQKHLVEFVGHDYVDMIDRKDSSQTEEPLA